MNKADGPYCGRHPTRPSPRSLEAAIRRAVACALRGSKFAVYGRFPAHLDLGNTRQPAVSHVRRPHLLLAFSVLLSQ
jgi:hypothetical protein